MHGAAGDIITETPSSTGGRNPLTPVGTAVKIDVADIMPV